MSAFSARNRAACFAKMELACVEFRISSNVYQNWIMAGKGEAPLAATFRNARRLAFAACSLGK